MEEAGKGLAWGRQAAPEIQKRSRSRGALLAFTLARMVSWMRERGRPTGSCRGWSRQPKEWMKGGEGLEAGSHRTSRALLSLSVHTDMSRRCIYSSWSVAYMARALELPELQKMDERVRAHMELRGLDDAARPHPSNMRWPD